MNSFLNFISDAIGIAAMIAAIYNTTIACTIGAKHAFYEATPDSNTWLGIWSAIINASFLAYIGIALYGLKF